MTNLQVIGVGLGRSGTRSLQAALEDLGFGPGYDMLRAFQNPGQYHLYQKLYQEPENTEEVVKEILQGFPSTLSYPFCMYYEELIKWNPDAKLILTVRDSPETWVSSAQETIFRSNRKQNWFLWKFNKLVFDYMMASYVYWVTRIMIRVHGVDPNNPKTDLAQMYSDWNKRVIETVPEEKLLIFNVKEGWKPLCEFLGVQVPNKPFPRVNSREEWKRRVGAKVNSNIRHAVLKLILFIVLLYCVYSFFMT